MQMPERSFSSGSKYRFGFNGKEKDKDVTSDDYDFGARIYDSRIGRWLSVDPLWKKYPNLTAYSFSSNSPIIIIDFDGRDIVYFNSQGVEYKREKSATVVKTFVDVQTTVWVKGEYIPNMYTDLHPATTTSQVEVKMPDIITEKLTTNKDKDKNWISETGLDAKKFNQYDYQIAASTFLFNQSKNDASQKFVTDGGVSIPTAITKEVPDLDPTMVKELMMQETHCGTDASMNGTQDIMQVNNGIQSFQDYKPYKANYGLSNQAVPGPLLSITAGLKDLMTKGFKDGVTYDKKTGTQTFTFQGWMQAGKNYNGNGVPNYTESLEKMEATKRTSTANDY
jgi:RHS repeat-associated protein